MRSAVALALAGVMFGAARVGSLELVILKPIPSDAVFGEVIFVVDAWPAEDVRGVEFWIDGRVVGRLRQPPFRVVVDVGQGRGRHHFRAVTYGRSGDRASAEVLTRELKVDLEVGVELQQLYVTVTQAGERVLGLRRGDFQVLDNGVRQSLVTFESGDIPLTAVLMVDSSESMKGERLNAALDGARSFIAGMASLDEAMVLLFSDELLRTTPFTQNRQILEGALTAVAAGGGTAVNDHLYLALKLLDARQGRRVVVLLSDGADVHSALRMREVIWKARRSQALVYWIRLEDGLSAYDSFTSAWRNYEANRQELEQLEDLVAESGGRIETLESIENIDQAFRGILQELREQYVLGYYPSYSSDDGSWRKVRVQLSSPGMKLRTRGGYIDY